MKKHFLFTLSTLLAFSFYFSSCGSFLNTMDTIGTGFETYTKTLSEDTVITPLQALGGVTLASASHYSTQQKEEAKKRELERKQREQQRLEQEKLQAAQLTYHVSSGSYVASDGSSSTKSGGSTRAKKCSKCGGSGNCSAYSAGSMKNYCNGSGKCNYCNGDGYNYASGNRVTCSACKGTGSCKTCKGSRKCKFCKGTGKD